MLQNKSISVRFTPPHRIINIRVRVEVRVRALVRVRVQVRGGE